MLSMSADHGLDSLDDALAKVRRLWERPAMRRWFATQLGLEVELATVRTLRAVEQASTPPSLGDVADGLNVDLSTASRLVEQSVAGGYALRHTSAADRRRAEIVLTPAGSELLARATAARRQGLATATEGWPDDDIRILASLLDRLSEGLERVGR